MNSTYEEELRCAGCGKVVGRLERGKIVIRHRGRVVAFQKPSTAKTLEITCETCKMRNIF